MKFRAKPAAARIRASLMSTAACAVLLACAAGAAHAQDTTAGESQTADDGTTVVVTGIRRGLQDSISLKKKSTSIVEAVSAEDIGKLPDVSIAESLARLPGLAAQRVAGHAQVISIRGLSPDFSNTLLNGRMQVSTGDNRAAEFDQYPSELINSAIVYKTPDAGLVGQGLSGTVDLNTIHPLDFKHRVISIGARASHNSNGALMEDSKADGNRLNFAYVDQFADGKVGVALAYAHLDDPTQTKHSKSWWWDSTGGRLDTTPEHANDFFLNGTEVWDDSRSQKRDGYMGIIEFKPNDNFHSVNDLYYSKYDQTDTIRGVMWYQSQWADDIHITDPTFLTVNGGEIANGGKVSGVAPIVRNDYNTREDTMASIGSKNTWSWGNWNMLADLGYSEAKRNELISETYAGYGTDPTPVTRTFDTVDEHIAYGGFPTLDPGLNYGDATKVLLGDVAPWGGWGHDGTIRYPHVKDTLSQAKFQGTHELGWGMIESVDVGAAWSQRTKSKTVDEYNLCLKGGTMNADGTCHGPRVAVEPKYLVDSADLGWAGFGGVLSYDIPAVEAAYYDTQAIADTPHYNKAWEIQEDMTTGFARFNLRADLAGIGLRGNFGVQVVGAKQQSDGVAAQCSDDDHDDSTPCVLHQLPAHFQASYTDVLPSMNLIFDLSDKTDIRLAMARQMARPRMDDLRSNIEGGVDISTNTWGGSGGNPLLKPWRANAIDIAVEHYFSKASYVGVAWFRKYLTSYIRNETITDFDFTGYPNPSGATPTSNIGNFTHPVNGEGGNVEGLEISGAMEGRIIAPWLDGFGVIGSWSRGWTDIAAGDPTDPGKLPGFSGTVTNVTGYYEKYGFSARISERWRSAELGETTQLYANRATTRILPDKQIDAQLSYDFPDNSTLKGLSLVLQAYNLTNSAYQTQLKVTENKTANGNSFPEIYEQYGTTWIFGVNYKFQ